MTLLCVNYAFSMRILVLTALLVTHQCTGNLDIKDIDIY